MMAGKEPIHSGHFMTSNPHTESPAESDVEVDVVDEDDAPSGGQITGSGKIVSAVRSLQDFEKPVTFYKFGPQKTQSIAIDISLNKLNKCIKTAYNKMTTPKWKDFKGLRLHWKQRIRLNNVIWRAYFIEFRKPNRTTKTPYCYFAVPDDDMTHAKVEGSLIEGMYWKRRMEAVCAQYKRWRHFFRMQKRPVPGVSTHHLIEAPRKRSCSPTSSIKDAYDNHHHHHFNARSISQENSCSCEADGNLIYVPQPAKSQTPKNNTTDELTIDDLENIFTDTLFDSLNQPYMFPNPKEMAQSGNADIMQPGLLSLQPSLEEIMASLDHPFDGGASYSGSHGGGVGRPSSNPSSSSFAYSKHYGMGDYNISPSQQQQQHIQQQRNTRQTQQQQDPSHSSTKMAGGLLASSFPPLYSQASYDMRTSGSDGYADEMAPGSSTNDYMPQYVTMQQQQHSPGRSIHWMAGPSSSSSSSLQVNNNYPRKPVTPSKGALKAFPPQPQQIAPAATKVQPQSAERMQVVVKKEPVKRQRRTPAAKRTRPATGAASPAAATSSSSSSVVTVEPHRTTTAGSTRTSSTTYQPQLPPHTPASISVVRPCATSRLSPASAAVLHHPQEGVHGSTFIGSCSTVTMQQPPIAWPFINSSMAGQANFSPPPQIFLVGAQASTVGELSVSTHNLSVPQAIYPRFIGALATGGQPKVSAVGFSSPTVLSPKVEESGVRIMVSNYGMDSHNRITVSSSAAVSGAFSLAQSPLTLGSASLSSAHNKPSTSALSSSSTVAVPTTTPTAGRPLRGFRAKRAAADSTIDPDERKRMLHLSAEQNRRCALKDGFDQLTQMLPNLYSGGTKPTNAVVLAKGAEYIRQLLNCNDDRVDSADMLREEVRRLNGRISTLQSSLPSARATPGARVCLETDKQNVLQQYFDAYTRERSREQWQFWILAEVMKPLMASYKRAVADASSADAAKEAADSWAREFCQLARLRPVVSDTLVQLAISTPVMNKPDSLEQHIRDLLAKP